MTTPGPRAWPGLAGSHRQATVPCCADSMPFHIIEAHTCRVRRLSSHPNGPRVTDHERRRRLLGPCHLHHAPFTGTARHACRSCHSRAMANTRRLADLHAVHVCIGAPTLTCSSNSRIKTWIGAHRAADTTPRPASQPAKSDAHGSPLRSRPTSNTE